MPYKRLKYTFDYCKPNIPSFILVLIILFIIEFLNRYLDFSNETLIIGLILVFVLSTIIYGYGLSVTKNIIDNGTSLPKLEFLKSFILGVKSIVITFVYTAIQFFVLWFVARVFNFPFIRIGEGRIELENLGTLFYGHNGLETILFVVFVIVMLYVSTFFLEIALARLADKGSIGPALNMVSIEECISTIGWTHYASDYTKLILTILILAYIKYGVDLYFVDNLALDLIIGLLIFIIQYIGIGMIYKEYKDKKYGKTRKIPIDDY